MPANERIAFRYSFTPVNTALRRCLSEKPSSRPAISTLVAKRFTSHSQGPTERLVEVVDVEHQLAAPASRTSRSSTGAHHRRVWALSPELGVVERSAAMINAAPR